MNPSYGLLGFAACVSPLIATVVLLGACGDSSSDSRPDASDAGAGGVTTDASADAVGGTGGAGANNTGGKAGASGLGGSGGGGDDAGLDGAEDASEDVYDDAADGMVDVVSDTSPDGSVGADCDRLAALDTELEKVSDEAQRVLLVDKFFQEVELSGGFPVRCAPTATFFFLKPDAWQLPHVAGDFNDWSSTAAPMKRIAGDYYRVTLSVDTGAHRYLYKFTDGSFWLADPVARRFGYDSYGEYSLVQGGKDRGHLERHKVAAGNGLSGRMIRVYLPPGYETSSDSFAVLYVHDGQNLFDPNAIGGGWHLDETVEALVLAGEIRPMVVVGIDNTSARFEEYSHVKDVVEGNVVGGSGDAYFAYVTQQVMTMIALHYRTKTGPENTFAMGSSLGGLISLYFGLKHPEVFGRVAGLSSSLGWGSREANNPTLIELLPSFGHPPIIIYLDSGGSDGGGCVDSDGDGIFDDNPAAMDNYCTTIQMRDALEADGYEFGKNLFHWHEMGALHNEGAWRARVHRPLCVLAPP